MTYVQLIGYFFLSLFEVGRRAIFSTFCLLSLKTEILSERVKSKGIPYFLKGMFHM